MRKNIAIVSLLTWAAMSAQVQVRTVQELKGLPAGTEFEFKGAAKVYNTKYLGATIDDGSGFATVAVFDGEKLITADDAQSFPFGERYIVSSFKGRVIDPGQEPYLTPGPNHCFAVELSTVDASYMGEDVPMPSVMAVEGETFDDYMYRSCIMSDVTVTKSATDVYHGGCDTYLVETKNGAKGMFPVIKGSADLSGKYAWIEATPAGATHPTYMGYKGLDDVTLSSTPVAEVTKAQQVRDLEDGEYFAFKGEAVVYYADDSFVILDNGEENLVLGREYWSNAPQLHTGDVVTSFNGRIKKAMEGLEVTGGFNYNSGWYRINCNSVKTSGETRTLVPVEADDAKSFRDYSDQYVKFHNVTVSVDAYGHCECTLPNGWSAYLSYFVRPDSDIEGMYEDVTCLPMTVASLPGVLLYNVTFGNKAGVAYVAADAEVEYEYYDLQGRHIAAPTASGIYLVKGSDGSVTKLRK